MTHVQQQEPTPASNTPPSLLWGEQSCLDLTSSRLWMFYRWAASSKHPRLFVSLSVCVPVVSGCVSVLFRPDCRYLTVVLFGFWMYRVIPALFFSFSPLCILSHQINNKCNYSILSKKRGCHIKRWCREIPSWGNACVRIVSWCYGFFFLFSLPEKSNLACSWTLVQLWGFRRAVSSLVPFVKKRNSMWSNLSLWGRDRRGERQKKGE